ncbi:ketopantoate reductase family protein [Micromonospora sp. MA102]|uniref:ketopantoate reductase family protein n=1 Tax=Micromonospora sp. MA102 TaxID=2952755 RepID=UPI0021C9941D|nr:2-dehydropantoate 2-reductase N-terminal domain-containing protein [Micromonospora sp. MA102]
MGGYLVLGAGAIGGWLAHHLSAHGRRVTVVDTDADHVTAIREHGLTLLRPDGSRDSRPVAGASVPDDVAEGPYERVLLATKAHHVDAAARWLAGRLHPRGLVVLCQNGDTFFDAARHLGAARVAPAFVNFAADVVEPGVIRVGGPGQMVIGHDGGVKGLRVRSVVVDLAGFGRVTASDNVPGFLWAKRGVAAIFAATAMVDEHISDVIDTSRPVMSRLATEVYVVAAARGIRLEEIDGIVAADLTIDADPAARTAAFDRLVAFTRSMTGKPRSGVFRDLAVHRRPTEARPELLRLVEQAGAGGLVAPVLRGLAELIGDLEAGRRDFGRENLDVLARIAAENPRNDNGKDVTS